MYDFYSVVDQAGKEHARHGRLEDADDDAMARALDSSSPFHVRAGGLTLVSYRLGGEGLPPAPDDNPA